MTLPNPLTELADRVQALTSACRETDLAIELAIRPDGKIAGLMHFPRGFDGRKGTTWQIYQDAVCYETRNEQGHCYSNGGYPLPAVTGSLDAAVSAMPAGWFWEMCQDPVSAKIWTEGNIAYWVPRDERDIRPVTPILALLSAILRARAALENSHG